MKYVFLVYSAHRIKSEELDAFLSEDYFFLIMENHWGRKNYGGIWVSIINNDNPFYYVAKGFDVQREYADDPDLALSVMNEIKECCEEAIEIINRLGSVPKSILHFEFVPGRKKYALELLKNIKRIWPLTTPGNGLYEIDGINNDDIEIAMKVNIQDPNHPQT